MKCSLHIPLPEQVKFTPLFLKFPLPLLLLPHFPLLSQLQVVIIMVFLDLMQTVVFLHLQLPSLVCVPQQLLVEHIVGFLLVLFDALFFLHLLV